MTIIPWGRIALAAGVLALLGWAFYAIRDSGKEAGRAEGEEVRAGLAESLAHAQAQASTCSATLSRITTETERGVAEAEARAAAGERAAAEAAAQAKEAQAKEAQARAALSAAKRVPACKAQLEMTLCDDIPLL